MPRVAVVMPAFNEAEGIVEFLAEIVAALGPSGLQIAVIDDASTDSTAVAVRAAAINGLPVSVLSNSSNLGHGMSTLRALRWGLESGSDVVVSVDGDGQFQGSDIAAVAAVAFNQGVVAEGCRQGRADPWFRRIVSAITRLLVRTVAGSSPADANTPLRAYPSEELAAIFSSMPTNLVTPNLIISALLRQSGARVVEVPVQSLPRRGSVASGSTWGGGPNLLPSRKFIRFCWEALRQWWRLRGGSRLG